MEEWGTDFYDYQKGPDVVLSVTMCSHQMGVNQSKVAGEWICYSLHGLAPTYMQCYWHIIAFGFQHKLQQPQHLSNTKTSACKHSRKSAFRELQQFLLLRPCEGPVVFSLHSWNPSGARGPHRLEGRF